MQNNWKEITVQDLIDKGEAVLKTGPFGTQLKADEYVEKGTPVINVRNIGFGNIREEKLEFINKDTVDRLSSHLLKKDDIVFGRKGAVERHAFINEKYTNWFQGSDCLRLRIKSDTVLPRFLSYHFLTEQHKQWMMQQCSHGATMASLNQDIVSRIPVTIPSVEVQKKIVTTLSAFDDLIENNTRRIAILEEMARLIYREWFVRYRYPGHEKDKLVDSGTELGEVPEGWEVRKLENVMEHYIGGGWGKEEKKEKFPDPGYVIRGTDIPGATQGDISEVPFRYHKVSNLKSRKLKEGDIVFEVSGGSKGQPLGRSLLITNTLLSEFDSNVMCASFCKLMRVDQEITLPELLYLEIMEMYDDRRIMKYQVQSTGISNFKFSFFLEDLNVLIPPKEIQDKFAKIVRPLFSKIHLLGKKNTRLKETRDLLLPKLISGKVGV